MEDKCYKETETQTPDEQEDIKVIQTKLLFYLCIFIEKMPVKKPYIEHKRNALNPILFDNRSKKRPFTIKIIFLKPKAPKK